MSYEDKSLDEIIREKGMSGNGVGRRNNNGGGGTRSFRGNGRRGNGTASRNSVNGRGKGF